jgi:DNA polymerase-3 subunit alpha
MCDWGIISGMNGRKLDHGTDTHGTSSGLQGLKGFTHLHVHSHYTLMGSTAKVEDLAARARADGLLALALTDQSALYGVVAFTQACRRERIHPILGMTVDVITEEVKASSDEYQLGQLVLLAKGLAGYRSLCRISSTILTDPKRTTPMRALTLDDLKRNREDLICIEGGRQGRLETLLRAGDGRAARRHIAHLAGIFRDDLYLSLEIHGYADHETAQEIVGLGDRFGVPTLAVQPIYCLQPEERSTLALLAAIQNNCLLDELPPKALPGGGDPSVDVHWLSPDEIVKRFLAFQDAVARVEEVVHCCRAGLPEGRSIWPALDLPRGVTPEEALAEQARGGMASTYGPSVPGAIKQRLKHELEAITRQGYCPLFLVVADIVRYAREAEIPVSTRGSVANSLVAYCIGITTVDPIEHDLLFERFLNPARVDMPDIDIDLCSRRRDEILDYVRRTYGVEQVALVGTVSTMRLKSAVRETAKAYGYDEKRIKGLTARLPHRRRPDLRRRTGRTIEDVVRELDREIDRVVVRAGERIVGQPRHLSVHAGGVVITPGPLTDWLPVQMAPKGFLITQFDHADVEAIGLPKIDLLGVRALTVLADSVELVRRHHGTMIDLEAIPLEDASTGDMISSGDTIGVFQCESQGAQRTLRKLRACSVRDLAVANAFFKPGPATGGMATAFVRRYREEEPVSFLHPALEPILRNTKGVLIFQEQILRVAREIAGLSWEEADHLRRGMSRFRPDEMDAMEARFLTGCRRPQPDGPDFSAQQARTLWEQVVAFAGYGFNQGHATAYAHVSYRSAYLKAHWPAAFLCARLADRGGYHHPAVYMAEAVRLGIKIRPPHINTSGRRFTLTHEEGREGNPEPVLWMGLGAVSDMRRRTVAQILKQREIAPFTDLDDFIRRVALQRKELRHIIQCGGMDGLGKNRAFLLDQSERASVEGGAIQRSFDFMQEAETPVESAHQRLTWEREILGMPVTVHPIELLSDRLGNVMRLRELTTHRGRDLSIAGVRLPGWAGGDGYLLSDDDTYVYVRMGTDGPDRRSQPRPWQPIRLHGQWREDAWGGGWFQAQKWEALA